MGAVRDRCEHRLSLGQVLESNARRLDALDRQGTQVVVDAPAVLEFLFDRALADATPLEFRLNWVRNVAGLLNSIEPEMQREPLLASGRAEAAGRRPAR
jgi:hypothetical protein